VARLAATNAWRGGCHSQGRIFMMNQTGGWLGGGTWILPVLGVVMVVLLVVVIIKLTKK